jgi:hypothetical protein
MSTQIANGTGELIRLDGTRVAWREVDGEIVAVDMETAEYLTMNGTGALLWEELVGGTTEEALAGRLVDEYAIPARQADADIAAFLGTLRERGLVISGA